MNCAGMSFMHTMAGTGGRCNTTTVCKQLFPLQTHSNAHEYTERCLGANHWIITMPKANRFCSNTITKSLYVWNTNSHLLKKKPYLTTFAVSTHSGCWLSQSVTRIQSELSVASWAICTLWWASIKPFFLYPSPTGEIMPCITLYLPEIGVNQTSISL